MRYGIGEVFVIAEGRKGEERKGMERSGDGDGLVEE